MANAYAGIAPFPSNIFYSLGGFVSFLCCFYLTGFQGNYVPPKTKGCLTQRHVENKFLPMMFRIANIGMTLGCVQPFIFWGPMDEQRKKRLLGLYIR